MSRGGAQSTPRFRFRFQSSLLLLFFHHHLFSPPASPTRLNLQARTPSLSNLKERGNNATEARYSLAAGLVDRNVTSSLLSLLRRACLGAAIVLGEQPVELFRQHLETLVAALLLVHNLFHLRLPRGPVSVAHISTPVANAPAEQAKG